jgi:hypothetical protein
MNKLLVLVVRLILGLVFGVLLIRMFKPEWEIYHGVVLGLILFALAYLVAFLKDKK